MFFVFVKLFNFGAGVIFCSLIVRIGRAVAHRTIGLSRGAGSAARASSKNEGRARHERFRAQFAPNGV